MFLSSQRTLSTGAEDGNVVRCMRNEARNYDAIDAIACKVHSPIKEVVDCRSR